MSDKPKPPAVPPRPPAPSVTHDSWGASNIPTAVWFVLSNLWFVLGIGVGLILGGCWHG